MAAVLQLPPILRDVARLGQVSLPLAFALRFGIGTSLAIWIGVAGLIVAAFVLVQMKRKSSGNEKMVEIDEAMHEGAMV